MSLSERQVAFRWKDRAHGNRPRVETLDGQEFVARFLRHVVPRGLRTIRYYGFCHPAAKDNCQRIRIHTGLLFEPVPKKPTRKGRNRATGPWLCPCCHKPMRLVQSFFALWANPKPP